MRFARKLLRILLATVDRHTRKLASLRREQVAGARLDLTYSLVGHFRHLQSAFAGDLQPSVPDSRFGRRWMPVSPSVFADVFISRSLIVSRESLSVTTVSQTLLIVMAETGQIIAHSLQNTQCPTKMRTLFLEALVRSAMAPAGQTFPQRPHKIHFSGSIIGVPR